MNIVRIYVELLKEQFSYGIGNSLFMIFLISIPFLIGVIAKSNKTRIISSVVVGLIFVVLISTSFGRVSQAYPIGGFIFGFLFYLVPFLTGLALHKPFSKIMDEVNAEEEKKQLDELRSLSDSDLVGRIETLLSSVIGVNHEWVKKNWHQLTDTEKADWVVKNKSALISNATKIKNTVDMITFMQKINRDSNKPAA